MPERTILNVNSGVYLIQIMINNYGQNNKRNIETW